MTTREGFVYVITNEAWPECVKVGRAFDPESRLNGYQTSSPHRDYELYHAVYFSDCYHAELAVHARLAHLQQEGEWFHLPAAAAAEAIDNIKEII